MPYLLVLLENVDGKLLLVFVCVCVHACVRVCVCVCMSGSMHVCMNIIHLWSRSDSIRG
jgi:hypothetical protein